VYGDLVTDLLRGNANRVVVETRFLPTITLDDPFGPSPPGATPIASYLKPKITLYGAQQGSKPQVFAPYGEPGESLFPFVAAGAAIIFGIGLITSARGITAMIKGR
jgi:hypothetical protein